MNKGIDYCPKSVKELLIDMKDTSELMVDLSFAAVIYEDWDIAQEVMSLEEKMKKLEYHMWIAAMLSARNLETARELAGVLRAAYSAMKISSAAADIANIVLRDMQIPLELKLDLRQAEETVVRVKLSEDSVMCGKSLEELELEAETGMWVIAIRRGSQWIYNPGHEVVLKPQDVLFARGHDEGVPHFVEMATGKKYESTRLKPSTVIDDLSIAVDIIVEMKNISELSVGLAYFALLYNEEEIAKEVEFLEEKMDDMKFDLQRWVLQTARRIDDVGKLRGLLHLASSSELVSDAALDMANVVLRGMVPSRLLQLAVRDSEEIITQVVVEEGSQADGRSLGELRLGTETGMYVLAIRRRGWWIYDPSASTVLRAGDRLIARGTITGEEHLRELCSSPQSSDVQ
ncbi:potassium channel family protein [Methermicoccus shengliensis]|uniref:Potassium channel protein n=1 Tax=Methermicoccus shengliensis TaxID=660064 RepID=A0A832VZH0_9EURY|nr:MAG: TrkA-C domain protein [Euryarchaeota archaeon 55_53]KUK30492.1 MAG: TrkA-C domain protein [Methanosarcinales archeaon 56_1174]HIH69559.1 potassium channel protein [Methermicoccus shengliensis]